jgi:UDP-2-acetamido-3-amino-2,3-dideoxy-glucuronate N-acetyltransferase
VIDNHEINGVVIAAPASIHFKLAKKYLLAGKDVMVEKPLALTKEEGEELVNIVQKEKRILMVGHILQYHPAVVKLKEMIDSGDLGKIRYIYSNRLNIGKLRTEENVLWSFAPHDISIILMLMGEEEPEKVSAFGGSYLNQAIFDTTLTELEFKNGVKSHIFVSWLHPFKEQKLVVIGSEKMAVFDDISKEKLFIYEHKIKWEKGKIPIAEKSCFILLNVLKTDKPQKQMQKRG